MPDPISATIASTVVGAGTSIYGADKQRKLTNQTNDANRAAAEKADETNYRRYLMTRGIGEGGAPVNTKLPLWMGVTKTATGGFRATPTLPSSYTPRSSSAGGSRSWAALGL